MACRELKSYDLVRFVDKDSPLHGRNGTVLYLEENYARVQFNNGGTAACIYAHVDNLLVRHEPTQFIFDGKLDEVKKREWEHAEALKIRQRRELDNAETIQYNHRRITVSDDYGDDLELNYGTDWVSFDMFGEQLIFTEDAVQGIVTHLQKFLNKGK